LRLVALYLVYKNYKKVLLKKPLYITTLNKKIFIMNYL
jgi:hypothetical protein